MGVHVMFTNADTAKKNFIRCGFPFYAVCDSKNETLWINDKESDIEEAAEMLKEDLSMIREYNSAVYVIKHFKEVPKGGIKKSSEPECISTYKQGIAPEIKENYQNERYAFQNELVNTLRSMQTEMSEIKMKLALEESETDEEVKESVTGIGLIGKVLESPQVVNLLTNICANLFTDNVAGVKALAGTEKDTIENILDRLLSKGVTIQDLQKLSNMEVSQITMLLNLLRAQ